MSNYTDNHVIDDQNHVWNKILAFVPDESEVLDIGCSSGNLGEFLQIRKKCVVDGVEPDKEDAKMAGKKLRQVWNKSIEQVAKDISKKYDVLIFADVLEHLLYPSEVLKVVKDLLKPTGRVVFSVPNMSHVSIRLALLRGDWKYTETGLLDKTHLHYWDLDTVTGVFADASMNIIEVNSSVYQYPRSLINKRLDDIGLKASKKGLETLMGIEASAYEIVGYAERSKTKGKKTTLPSSALHQDEGLLAHDLMNQVDHYRQHVADLEKHISAIESSKAYKLTRRLQKTSSLFRGTQRG